MFLKPFRPLKESMLGVMAQDMELFTIAVSDISTGLIIQFMKGNNSGYNRLGTVIFPIALSKVYAAIQTEINRSDGTTALWCREAWIQTITTVSLQYYTSGGYKYFIVIGI